MPSLAKNTRATVIPCLRYRNAPAAIEWLCNTFGFERHLVVPGAENTIAHAQLSKATCGASALTTRGHSDARVWTWAGSARRNPRS